MTNTAPETDTPPTPTELLADLGEFHTRTCVSPLPKHLAAMGWQAMAGSMAAGFARALHALNEAAPDKAAEVAAWYDGPLGDGPDPEEHTDWLIRHVAGGDWHLLDKWVEDGHRLAEASQKSVEDREMAEREPLRLALSQALGLGTGASWEAIQDRAVEMGRA